jgi:hypothetical protein
MRSMTRLIAVAAAVGSTALAFGQALNQTAPQPQPGSPSPSDGAPPPPSSNPSVTWTQQPISGNSTATSLPNSMAPNAAGPDTDLAALLPHGMSQQEAYEGIKTTNECAAMLHAAQNLNIPFADLKSQIAAGQQLEGAIHAIKPDVDAAAEARRAEQQARSDLKSQGRRPQAAAIIAVRPARARAVVPPARRDRAGGVPSLCCRPGAAQDNSI